VLEPELKDRGPEEPVPHVYPDGSLCLFYPRQGEWDHTMLVAETTISWASLWLYNYEVWRLTGDWIGGGVHHKVSSSNRARSRRAPKLSLDAPASASPGSPIVEPTPARKAVPAGSEVPHVQAPPSACQSADEARRSQREEAPE
jgi:hypothetical protein